MKKKILISGNEAMGEAAIRAGCKFYAGYPITPQNELIAYMASELPKRGGGTRFTPVFDALDELPRCPSALVYLTDGDGAYPEQSPGFPVIWLLTQAWTVPFGTTILMEEGI